MLKAPGMLMVGSAGRNAGKTEFVCSLLNRFGSQHDIVGIKVTTVRKIDGSCPRGGTGCGVCSSFEGRFSITEEMNKGSNKDTAKMLAAGAGRVFWLRGLKVYLRDGITALLDIIGDEAISVCESNSLRLTCEPDLFFMLKHCNYNRYKSSAHNVAEYVDRIVLFDGKKFDIDLSDISITNGKWGIRAEATAIIMAGGESVRMGQNKSMLAIESQPMIKHICDQLRPHFNQILISSNDTSKYSFLGAEVIPDEVTGQGPLGGIASALRASANEVNFVIACDIPQVDMGFVRMMLREARGCDAVVPTTGPSQYEPLFAVYRKGTLAAIEDALSSGQYRVTDALRGCDVKYVELTGAQWLTNLNTMNDYWEFVKKKNDAHL